MPLGDINNLIDQALLERRGMTSAEIENKTRKDAKYNTSTKSSMPKNPLISSLPFKPWSQSDLKESLTTQAVGRAAENARIFRIEAERREDSIKKIQMDSIKKSSTVNLKKIDTDTFNLLNHSNSFYAIIVFLIFSLFIITKFIVKRCS